MRWPRWRLTIRSVMFAVAIVGVMLGGVSLRIRQRQYQALAAVHTAHEAEERARGKWAGRMASKGYMSGREEVKARATADRHARLKMMYESAATRPWRNVPSTRE